MVTPRCFDRNLNVSEFGFTYLCLDCETKFSTIDGATQKLLISPFIVLDEGSVPKKEMSPGSCIELTVKGAQNLHILFVKRVYRPPTFVSNPRICEYSST